MLDLLDYRRRVSDLYHTIRESGDQPGVCAWFRQQRDELFRTHSQSALDAGQKAAFTGLEYYPYDPAYRVIAPVSHAIEPVTFQIDLGDDGSFSYLHFGEATFELPTGTGKLSLFWIMGYGGGLFVPFGDTTNNDTTYGGGRYLYDTIKGADLGAGLTQMVLDFNYAYNPSCAYHARWVCPLAPPENHLHMPILTGEKKFKG
jgi:uncharacterized protein (DUF1684 family)